MLQRNFVYIGHSLAILLKQDYGVTDFCAYVANRRSLEFIKNQTDLTYSGLILDEDAHKKYLTTKLDLGYLQKLEDTYGRPNLWFYLAADRTLMCNQGVREYPYCRPMYSHTELLKILQATAQTLTEFLDQEKPDFCFFSPIASLGNLLLYQMAKRRNIKTFVIGLPGIKNHFILSQKNDYFSDVETLFEGPAENISPAAWEKAKNFLAQFRNQPATYYHQVANPETKSLTRRKQFQFLLQPKKLLLTIKLFAAALRVHYSTLDRHDYSYQGPWNYLKDGLRRKARNLRGVNDLYESVDLNENFVFFPLHLEPELSLLVLAPFYSDQQYVIKQIARSLPVGYRLYVKEHPLMVPYRPRAYYEELKKIPNVKLINPTVTGFEIIPHAKLITTITGTVGWEATLLQKPVICFGDVFYNRLPFVQRCTAIAELPRLVEDQLHRWRYDENEMLKFLAAIFEDAAAVDLLNLWEVETDAVKKKEGLRPLADLLAKKLGLPRPAAIRV